MTFIRSIIDSLYDFSDWGTSFIVATTVSAALLSAVVCPINLLARRWLTAGQMSLLWGLVLLRLLVPIGPASALSFQNFFEGEGQRVRTAAASPTTMESWMSSPRTTSYEDIASSKRIEVAVSDKTQVPSAQPAASTEAEIPGFVLLGYSLLLVWSCGALFVVLTSIVKIWRFSRRVSHAPLCHDQRLLQVWRQSLAAAGVRREIPIVIFEGIRQPSIMGVLHPCLLLPPDLEQWRNDQLNMIMLHELAHVRRFDVGINWVLLLVRALHWWNPIYWLAASRYSSLREQACDAFVLRRLRIDSRPGYGELLIALAARGVSSSLWRVRVPASILSIFSSVRRRPIASRLRALPAAVVKRNRVQRLAVSCAILLVAYCGLTSAKSDSNATAALPNQPIFSTPLEQSEFPDESEASSATVGATPVTREYDLGPVIDGIARNHLSRDEALVRLKFLLNLQTRTEPSALGQPSTATPTLQGVGRLDPSSDALSHIEVDGDKLRVTCSPHQQAELGRLMGVWKQNGLAQIAVDYRLITRSSDLPSQLAIPLRYAAPPSLDDDKVLPLADDAVGSKFHVSARIEHVIPVVYAVLSPEKASALIGEVQMSPQANVIQSPKVTCFNGQLVLIADLSQRPFVTGIHEQAAGVLTPKISIASEGTKIQLRPVLSDDRKSVQVNSRISLSGIDDVKAARIKTSIPDADPVEVQVPHLERYTIDVNAEIPDGHSLLLAMLPESNAKQMTYLLLTPCVVATD
jgi:bla regulator protein blaR1